MQIGKCLFDEVYPTWYLDPPKPLLFDLPECTTSLPYNHNHKQPVSDQIQTKQIWRGGYAVGSDPIDSCTVLLALNKQGLGHLTDALSTGPYR